MKIIKIIKIIKLVFILLIITSCNFSKEDKENSNKKESIVIETDSILVPKFEIELNLSKEAEKKLNLMNENLVITINFWGGAKDPSLTNGYPLIIGKKNIEINKERIIKVYDCKISKKDLDLLSDKNYEVNISVGTAWKSCDYNFLECDFLQDYISNVKNKRHILKGGL